MSTADSGSFTERDLQVTELERTILTEIVDLHPDQLTIPELILRVARDPNDEAMKDKVRIVVRDLRCDGLVRYRSDDEVVAPTRAATRMNELLTA